MGGESAGIARLGWWEWVLGMEREKKRVRERNIGVIEIRERMVK